MLVKQHEPPNMPYLSGTPAMAAAMSLPKFIGKRSPLGIACTSCVPSGSTTRKNSASPTASRSAFLAACFTFSTPCHGTWGRGHRANEAWRQTKLTSPLLLGSSLNIAPMAAAALSKVALAVPEHTETDAIQSV